MDIYNDGIYKRLFKYSEGSQLLLVIGLIFSMLCGLIYPAFTIFFAKMLGALFEFSYNKAQGRIDANFYALVFTYIAIIGFFSNLINSSIFNIVSDRITTKVRL